MKAGAYAGHKGNASHAGRVIVDIQFTEDIAGIAGEKVKGQVDLHQTAKTYRLEIWSKKTNVTPR